MLKALGLLFFVSFAHASIPTSWKEISAPGVDKMWQATNVKGAYLSLMKETDTYSLEDFNAKFYVTNIPEIREFMNGIMGIKNYQINKHTSERLSDAWIVKLEGSYIRRGEVPVNFCEIHKFTSSTFVQKQLLFPTSSSEVIMGPNDCFELIEKIVQ